MAKASDRRTGKAAKGPRRAAVRSCRIQFRLPERFLAPHGRGRPPSWRETLERLLVAAGDQIAVAEAAGVLTLDVSSDYGREAVPFAEQNYLFQELVEKLPPLVRNGNPAQRCVIRRSGPEIHQVVIEARFEPAHAGGETTVAGAPEIRDSSAPPTVTTSEPPREPLRLPPHPEQPQQEPPVIGLEEVAAVEAEVDALRATAIERLQGLLDRLAGRRGESREASETIARTVDSLARRIGAQLICREEQASIRWSKRVFEARTTDAARKTLAAGVDFPALVLRSKESGPATGEAAEKAPRSGKGGGSEAQR